MYGTLIYPLYLLLAYIIGYVGYVGWGREQEKRDGGRRRRSIGREREEGDGLLTTPYEYTSLFKP
jgi:hypothetical protein